MTTEEQGPPDPPAAPRPASLGSLRQSLTGKLRTVQSHFDELDPAAAAREKLDELKAKGGASTLGLLTNGLLHHAAGTPTPPKYNLDDLEVGFSREEVLDEAVRRQEEAAALSKKRMAFIVAFVKDPTSNPIFSEKPVIFKVFTEERTYQHEVLARLNDEFNQLPPPPEAMGLTPEEIEADFMLVAQEARRAQLSKQIKHANAVQTQIYNQLVKLTGGRGLGEGAAYVPLEPVAEITAETSSSDAFDIASKLLDRL